MGFSSLILEGGGMRGVYTAGVLDYFLKQNISFDNVYGVSAGSFNGVNFVSKQANRSYATLTDYIEDARHSGMKHLIQSGDFFNIDFIYNQIPNSLNVFDYETFLNSKTKFCVVVSNIVTGKAEYIQCTDMKKDMNALRASGSLPLLAKPVYIKGRKYLDGGMCDSIPLEKSIKDGNNKNVVILTQHKGYEKSVDSQLALIKMVYKNYPNFVKAVEERHLMYNKQTDYVFNKQETGQAFVIQPSHPVKIDRLEKDKDKLLALYNQGYADGQKYFDSMIEYLNK